MPGPVEWESQENLSLINPKFSEAEKKARLQVIAERGGEFQGHLFFLTSGTTAQTSNDFKWVALSKEAFLHSAWAVNQHLQSTASDRWLHVLPDFHVGGVAIWARSYLSGAGVIAVPEWNLSSFWAALETSRANLISLVPTQVFDLIQTEKRAPSFVKAVIVGGGALPLQVFQKAKALGWPLLPSYGMTEASSQIATACLAQETSFEFPRLSILPHFEVQETEGGRLKFRSRSLLSAYLLKEEDRISIQDPKEKGWYLSQDYGECRDGFLTLRGRSSDFCKIGGENVELGPLRSRLDDLRTLMKIHSDLTLLAVPDERLGHQIYLISDFSLGPKDAEALIENYNDQVLGFERIRQWTCLNRIPRTPLGKLIPQECLMAVKALS